MYSTYKDPENAYKAYQKLLRKKEYQRAYGCLERLLKEFPEDPDFLEEILDLSLNHLKNPRLVKPWLVLRAKRTSTWIDHLLLSQIEAELGNISKAKEYLETATKLQKKQKWSFPPERDPKSLLTHARGFIKLQEYNLWLKKQPQKEHPPAGKKKVTVTFSSPQPLKVTKKEGKGRKETQGPIPIPVPMEAKRPATVTLPVRFGPLNHQGVTEMFQTVSSMKDCQLRIEYAYLNIQRGFDDLLCIGAIKGVERYWYQVETAKKVLKYFHGRVLLGDEVGLGKTIEAGMLIKEYLLRDMVKNILILTPAPLVSQWREEMEQKFDIGFVTTEDTLFQTEPERFWKNRFIIASLHVAKGSKNFTRVVNEFYDLVVVDEAHHLKNRKTLNWKLLNEIKKRFIFLLTATPVQNNLMELYNLITLLKPGQFKTERLFKSEFLKRGDPQRPVNKEKLRELLRDVMIRNTRSAIDLRLPRRFASTLRLEPTAGERQLYEGINHLARDLSGTVSRPIIQLLMRVAGSSPFALRETLSRIQSVRRETTDPILATIDGLGETSKGKALVELLQKNPSEKKVIFTQYLKSMDYILSLLSHHGLPHVTFRGEMTGREKDNAIKQFQDNTPILVSTESGGEGRNMQFCNTIINFDLPWNPMRIEQRIGRLHRIGQTRDVFIFNLVVTETLEDHILHILDTKINMFELVIGEIEPILGYLGEERDFEEIIMEIWLKSGNKEEIQAGFESLGQDLIEAKEGYLKSKELDVEIFGEEYEV